jgi:hypothetical protein
MENLKEKVAIVLSEVPETRNSDIALTIEIWKRYYPKYVRRGQYGDPGIYLKDLFELPREDNIKRIRAKYNSIGLYLPTEWAVAKGRGILENEWRKAMGYNPILL